MKWMAKTLRGNAVFARVNSKGELATRADGRVDIIYKLAVGAKVYRAAARNLEAADSTEIVELDIALPAAPDASKLEGDPIFVFTDGACSGNPGPAGIGVVILDGRVREEISEHLGTGTNNIAELTAILRALQSLPAGARERPIRLHTDSSYAIGLITKNWKAKANQELVAELRALARQFPGLQLIKVKGHSGVAENERADQLAVEGAKDF